MGRGTTCLHYVECCVFYGGSGTLLTLSFKALFYSVAHVEYEGETGTGCIQLWGSSYKHHSALFDANNIKTSSDIFHLTHLYQQISQLFKTFDGKTQLLEFLRIFLIRLDQNNRNISQGCRPKKKSIFKDIVQIGGREINPISKNAAKRTRQHAGKVA